MVHVLLADPEHKIRLPRITWHCLRHCHATLLDAAPEIARQIYLHAIPAEQRQAGEENARCAAALQPVPRPDAHNPGG
jgi:hypothetical protein